jgi:hypothetical protein
MGFSVDWKNKVLDHTFGNAAYTQPTNVFVAVYIGASEVNLARVQTAAADWNSAASGALDNANEIAFAEADSGTDTGQVSDFRLFDASTGGNEIGRAPFVGTKEAFVADAGNDTLTVPNHGFSNDDQVRVMGENLPAGIDADTAYFVINSAADTLQLSATQSGSAIDLTADGFGELAVTAYKTLEEGTTLRFAAGDLDVQID